MDLGREYHMSLFDTIRCAWHDPGFLLTQYDEEIGGLAVMFILFVMWGL
jgi:hypothetical protein